MTPHLLSRGAVVGLAAASTLTLAACGSGTTPASAGSTTNIASSAAASAASSAGPGGVMSSTGAMDTAHNAADVTFAQQMIVHHRGAVEMADLAPTRADSQQVKDLAADIKAAQAPEIQQMTDWLQAWGTGADMSGVPNTTTSSGGGTGMNHGGTAGTEMMPTGAGTADAAQMPGMMTADEAARLTAATGAAFDRLFLQLMIVHHQGAVQMADTELARGVNPGARALAGSIKTSQTQQIATMQQLLTTL